MVCIYNLFTKNNFDLGFLQNWRKLKRAGDLRETTSIHKSEIYCKQGNENKLFRLILLLLYAIIDNYMILKLITDL